MDRNLAVNMMKALTLASLSFRSGSIRLTRAKRYLPVVLKDQKIRSPCPIPVSGQD